MLGANLGSLLYGEVPVMSVKVISALTEKLETNTPLHFWQLLEAYDTNPHVRGSCHTKLVEPEFIYY